MPIYKAFVRHPDTRRNLCYFLDLAGAPVDEVYQYINTSAILPTKRLINVPVFVANNRDFSRATVAYLVTSDLILECWPSNNGTDRCDKTKKRFSRYVFFQPKLSQRRNLDYYMVTGEILSSLAARVPNQEFSSRFTVNLIEIDKRNEEPAFTSMLVTNRQVVVIDDAGQQPAQPSTQAQTVTADRRPTVTTESIVTTVSTLPSNPMDIPAGPSGINAPTTSLDATLPLLVSAITSPCESGILTIDGVLVVVTRLREDQGFSLSIQGFSPMLTSTGSPTKSPAGPKDVLSPSRPTRPDPKRLCPSSQEPNYPKERRKALPETRYPAPNH